MVTAITTIIHITPHKPLAILDERGWTKGTYESAVDGRVCLHGAIRLCQPVPGDAHIIERVAGQQGWGTGWNDEEERTEAEVRDLLGKGIDITDIDLADTFGPQWETVVEIVRRCAVLTADEVEALTSAHTYTAADIKVVEYRDAAYATYAAARDAAYGAAFPSTFDTYTVHKASAVTAAAIAAATWHLATPEGPYTITHRDLLMAPWAKVIGLPESLQDGRNND